MNVYLLDISQPRSDVVQSVNQAGWNHIAVCSSPDNSGYYGTYLWELVNKTIRPAGGSITLPGVFIFDRNQAVTLSETGLVTQDRLAEVLLEIDSTLNLNTYISANDIYLVNMAGLSG